MSDVEESIDNQLESNDVEDISEEENNEKKSTFKIPEIKLPKWALILLMILPAAIFITIIMLVDVYVGFSESINPIAIIAIVGIGIIGFVVIGDMVYRNYFSYRMVRRESAKAKIYKEIIRDKQKAKEDKARYESIEDEYEYEDDEDSDEYEYEDDEPEIDEYQYDLEPEIDEEEYYRLRSLIFRGGLFSILIVNGLIILAAAAILQLTYGGGFSTV